MRLFCFKRPLFLPEKGSEKGRGKLPLFSFSPTHFITINSNEMANTIKALFWVYKSRLNENGKAPLMIRLSFQKKRLDKSTGHFISPKDWNAIKQQLKGKDQAAIELNNWIHSTKVKVIKLAGDNSDIHLPTIFTHLFSAGKEEPGLLEVINEHNRKLKERVGNDYTYSTYEKYVFTRDKVEKFIQAHYKEKDIFLKDLTGDFIIEFDHYLRAKDKNQHNTAVKYCLNLKKIINEAVLRGLMKSNPFKEYKTVYRDTPQIYLQKEELILIEGAELIKPHHLLARDLFLFQCYTGLAYTDMTNLSKSDFSLDNEGRMWIIKQRQKTGITSYIPVFPETQSIIVKYQTSIKRKTGLLPFYSIQKYNQYINEVGKIAGINPPLSSHVGRRTFGNIALAKGFSINVISKILGHSNTLITQRIYAITTQRIVSKEIDKW